MEVTLHKHIGLHNNIIAFYESGENDIWRWIAMELADGGDLFDKIEPDEGVGEDIAHVYFLQLVSAIGYMHSKGVGHRDIKPENMLLSADGNLKIADFGLATLFQYNGKTKLSTTLCGSPPYIAPEVVQCSSKKNSKGVGYSADLVDIWSCGIVLFTLLAGNTPWDAPTQNSYEFSEYVRTNAKPEDDELWDNLPTTTLSLLRGMLKVDPKSRFSMQDVRKHPWFTRQNKFISEEGKLINPINLATTLFESLHIDLEKAPFPSSQPTAPPASDRMDIDDDTTGLRSGLSSTQPEAPVDSLSFDWDGPPRLTTNYMSSSQPKENIPSTQSLLLADRLTNEPSMSQFSPTPSVPLSRTQNAQKFHDIVPPRSLTRFFSTWALHLLVPLICEALHRLGVPATPSTKSGVDNTAVIRVRTKDGRTCPLHGNIIVEVVSEDLAEVEFVKVKGDPLEWRRFFKKVTVICRDAVYKPEN